MIKILAAIVLLLLLAGGGFYLWLVIAFTPPKGPPLSTYREITLKEGFIDAPPRLRYLIYSQGFADQPPQSYVVSIGPAVDDLSQEPVLRVAHGPVPMDVTIPAPRQVEVHFETPYNGKPSVIIPVGENYLAAHPLEIDGNTAR